MKHALVTPDAWDHLRQFTRARIALGRAGGSLPTREVLDFGCAHALARDAVHTRFASETLALSLQQAGFETLSVQSRAPDRATYLLRPDLGRKLSETGAETLKSHPKQGVDLLLVVGDGLSSLAVHNHAQPLLEAIRAQTPGDWRIGPVVLVTQARVAISDEIGAALKAEVVVMLVGERPGLSSPDSLGVYLTYQPHPGRQDGERNCISNVCPQGLSYADAARKTVWLARQAMTLKCSGVALKDQSDIAAIASEPGTLSG